MKMRGQRPEDRTAGWRRGKSPKLLPSLAASSLIPAFSHAQGEKVITSGIIGLDGLLRVIPLFGLFETGDAKRISWLMQFPSCVDSSVLKHGVNKWGTGQLWLSMARLASLPRMAERQFCATKVSGVKSSYVGLSRVKCGYLRLKSFCGIGGDDTCRGVLRVYAEHPRLTTAKGSRWELMGVKKIDAVGGRMVERREQKAKLANSESINLSFRWGLNLCLI